MSDPYRPSYPENFYLSQDPHSMAYAPDGYGDVCPNKPSLEPLPPPLTKKTPPANPPFSIFSRELSKTNPSFSPPNHRPPFTNTNTNFNSRNPAPRRMNIHNRSLTTAQEGPDRARTPDPLATTITITLRTLVLDPVAARRPIAIAMMKKWIGATIVALSPIANVMVGAGPEM